MFMVGWMVGGEGGVVCLFVVMVAEKNYISTLSQEMKYGTRRYNETPRVRAEERNSWEECLLRSAHTWVSIT
jgi:hypothetical protein